MSQSPLESVVGAIMAAALGIISVILGVSFLPSGTKAYEDGTLVPWLLAWGMIWVTALAALALTGFLIVTRRGGASGS